MRGDGDARRDRAMTTGQPAASASAAEGDVGAAAELTEAAAGGGGHAGEAWATDADDGLHDLAAAYSLDALDPEDEQAFVAHLTSCAQCQEAVADFAEVAGHLGVLTGPEEPPARLRESLLARALAEEPGRAGGATVDHGVVRPTFSTATSHRPAVVPPPVQAGEVEPGRRRHVPGSGIADADVSTGGAAAPKVGPGLPSPPGAGDAAVADLDARRRRRASGWLPWAVAAAAAAVAVVAGVGWVTSEQSEPPPGDVAAAQVLDCVRESSCTVVTLRPTPAGTGAGVALVRGSSVSLVLTGVPANNTRTSTYVLWQQVTGGPLRAVSTFDVATQVSVVPPEGQLVGGIERTALLAVSEEPGRTAPPAPSTPLLAGQTPRTTA